MRAPQKTHALGLFMLLIASFVAVEGVISPLFKIFPQGTPIYRGRADPIVSPGVISNHAHRVMGGSAFSLSSASKTPLDVYNDMFASKCTTNSITVDKSAYWTPDLYYQWPNGSLSEVPTGGMTIYYFGRAGSGNQSNPTYYAFPKGFRMLAGDPFHRSFNNTIPEQAISYVCLGSTAPEQNGFPTASYQCVNGLRAQVFFPQCWDGINIDTPNHKDHVAYPSAYNTGNCPSTHPYRIPAVFYEVLYSVDQSKFPHGLGTNPFVWACGDPTGYGFHGDFLNGWDINILQAAMTDPSCDHVNTNEGNIPQNCLPLTPYVKAINDDQSCLLDNPILNYEDLGIGHWISHLPGADTITYGPAEAVPISGSYAQTIDPTVYRVLLKSVSNGKYVSCLTYSGTSNVVIANVTQDKLSYSQVFDFVPVGNGKYAMLTESSVHYVSSNNGGTTSPLTGDRNSPSDWEYWTITFTGGSGPTLAGTIGYLTANNGKYVGVLAADNKLYANSVTVTAAEQFYFIDANAGVVDTRPGSSSTATAGTSTTAKAATTTTTTAKPTTTTTTTTTTAKATTTTTTTAKPTTTTTTTNSATTTTTSTKATTTTTTASAATSTKATTTTTGSSTTGGAAVNGYVGCYVDSTTHRDLNITGPNSTVTTIEKCKYYCGERLYAYAGLQGGNQCFCGNSYGSQGAATSSTCNIPCVGNSSEVCGGASRNSVYQTGNVGFLGCYVDAVNTRDLPTNFIIYTGQGMTIDRCRQGCYGMGYVYPLFFNRTLEYRFCSSSYYAGAQYASQCFCGNAYGSLGIGAVTDCNMPCQGDVTEMCGAGYPQNSRNFRKANGSLM